MSSSPTNTVGAPPWKPHSGRSPPDAHHRSPTQELDPRASPHPASAGTDWSSSGTGCTAGFPEPVLFSLAPFPSQTRLRSPYVTLPSLTHKTNTPGMHLSRPDTHCVLFFNFLPQMVRCLALLAPLDSVQMSPSEKAFVCFADGSPPTHLLYTVAIFFLSFFLHELLVLDWIFACGSPPWP